MLTGKKTYIVGAVVAGWNLLCSLVPELSAFQGVVNGILGGLGLVTLRAGVKDAKGKGR